jgi:hypothetical protein
MLPGSGANYFHISPELLGGAISFPMISSKVWPREYSPIALEALHG